MSARTYGYSINLDERGEFYADVRDADGTSVFEIHPPDAEGGSIFEDGFMRHKNDLAGLQDYLTELGVIPRGAEILPLVDFERRIEEQAELEPSF